MSLPAHKHIQALLVESECSFCLIAVTLLNSWQCECLASLMTHIRLEKETRTILNSKTVASRI